MNKLIITLLFISKCVFSQLVVHSKDDQRLLAYNDSMRCYHFTLKAISTARKLENNSDTSICRKARNMLLKEESKLNPKIKSIGQYEKLSIVFYIKQDKYNITTSSWSPNLYRKPKKVIYEPIINDTIKKVIHNYVYTINGKNVSKEEFERIYGKKTKN